MADGAAACCKNTMLYPFHGEKLSDSLSQHVANLGAVLQSFSFFKRVVVFPARKIFGNVEMTTIATARTQYTVTGIWEWETLNQNISCVLQLL